MVTVTDIGSVLAGFSTPCRSLEDLLDDGDGLRAQAKSDLKANQKFVSLMKLCFNEKLL